MRVLRFDAFTLDQSRRTVLRGGAELELRSQSFDVLNHLVEHAGQLVSKQDLFTAVWDGAARTDDSLVQCIKDIRQVLGDGEHRIIKTVHGRGYRFVAEVSEAAGPEVRPGTHASAPESRSDAAAAPHTGWHGGLIAVALLITALAGSGWLVWKHTRPGPPAALTMMTVPSLVILPVKPLGDETDTTLATLADEIATGVWRAPRGFKPEIRPPSAVKDAQGDPKAIGRDLAVRYVVRSSVRRESDVLHINVQLIEAESAQQVWVGVFDYRLGQPGAQNRTAARIGRTLAHELLRVEVRRPLPPRPEAGHYTMLGRALITDGNNAKANGEAIAYFEQAIGMEPENFLALAHLARATANGSLNGWLAPHEQDEKLAKAEAAIRKVLKDDPTAAAAHLIHANVLRAQGEHEQAIAALRHALLHNPNLANAYAELGRSLIDVGKADEAIAEIQKAIALSPTDITLYMWTYWAGLAALHQGDHQGALDWLRKSHQANRAHDNTLRLMAVALADAGREAEAREKIKEFLKLRPDATLDDWKRPNDRAHPAVAAPREHFRAALQRLGVPEAKTKAGHVPELMMMAEPSIAVLPFNPLGDATDSALAALADEIVTELWRAPRGHNLDIRPAVAAKNTFADPKGLGQELGVRYIVRSSARRESDRMHINIQLIEAESARQVWGAPFDYQLDQPGAQNRTAARIGRTIATELLQAEVRRPLPANPEAAHFTMLGRSLMNNERSAKTNSDAIAFFEKAINTDPNYFPALVNYGRATADHILNGWAPPNERAERLNKGEAAIKLAIKLEPTSAGAHLTHGGLLRARGDYEQAVTAFKQALLHNPNFANAHAELGRSKIDIGLANEAIAHVEQAVAISPTDFALYIWCYWAGLAALYVDDHEAALEWLRRSHQANRAHDNTLRLMAIAYAYAGREAEAHAKMGEFLKLRPGFTLSRWQQDNANPHPMVAKQRGRMAATMKLLGVPEVAVKAASKP